MKNSILVLFVFLFVFFGCSKKSPISDLEVKDGLYYVKGTTTLYSGKIESKYSSSGKDSISGSIVNGKFDGVVISYYENGNIKDSIDYKMGERKISKSYTEDGNPVCDCNEISFDYSTEVWMTINTKKVFDGMCISYWDNKNKKSSKVIKHGKVRESYEWYENGNEKESLIYNEEGKFKRKSYGYENGKPSKKEMFESGTVKTVEEWYGNGNQKRKMGYESGNLMSFEKWYENGNKCLNHQFTNTNGFMKSLDGWYESGKVLYHLESKPDKPIEININYFNDRTEDDFTEIIKGISMSFYGKGKTFFEDGVWMSEFFFEGEKPVSIKRSLDVGKSWESNDEFEGSISRVSKIKWLSFYSLTDPSTQYISKIDLYSNPSRKLNTQIQFLQDKFTTIEESLRCYSQEKLYYQENRINIVLK